MSGRSGEFPRYSSGVFPRFERRRRTMGWRSQDVLRAAALVIGLYVILRLLWTINPLVLTAFLGVLFGLAVEAGVDHLERLKIPRYVGAVSIVLGFYAILFGLGAWMAPTLITQSRELRTRLPQAVDKAEAWLDAHRDGFAGLIIGRGQQPPPPPPTTGGERVDSLEAPAATAADKPASLRDRLTAGLSGATDYLFPFLSSTLTVLAGIGLITFLAIYIGADPETYHSGLMHLFPHGARKRGGEVLSAMATVLRRWLVTQLIAMLVIGVVTTGILLLLDVKAAYALGTIAGLLEFIPTIGPILSAVPAVAMGFVDSPQKALYVVFAYIGIQFIENNLLIPMLMKGVDLPPALTLIGQALMAIVFGFLGLMVAVPLVAGLLVPIKMLYVEDIVGDEVYILGPGLEVEDDEDPGG